MRLAYLITSLTALIVSTPQSQAQIVLNPGNLYWNVTYSDEVFSGSATGAWFRDARIFRSTAQSIDFSGVARFEDNSFWVESVLQSANFSDAQISDTDFLRSDLLDTNFSGATIANANFNDSYMYRVNFENAFLNVSGNENEFESVSFSDTNLRFAKFDGATLSERIFFNRAYIADADFSTTTFAENSVTSFNDAYLDNVDFTEANFSGELLFSGARMRNVDFSNNGLAAPFNDTDLFGANFTNSYLVGSNFDNAILEQANLTGATLFDSSEATYLHTARFRDAILTGADLRSDDPAAQISALGIAEANPDLSNVNFSGNIMQGYDFSGKTLISANLSSTDLTGANLSEADLTSADLTGANLTHANLTHTDATKAISNAQLQSASSIAGVNLSGSDLTGFDLSNENLSSANLSSTNLTNANLTSANLASANLTSATLTGATLTDANFHQAQLPAVMPTLPVVPGAVVNVASALDVSSETNVQAGGTLMINTASFTTSTLDIQGGFVITTAGISQSISGNGTLTGDVSGAADKTITASGGPLVLGSVASTTGFAFGGTLDVADQQVTLLDADVAELGASTTLAAGGRLLTTNGALLGSGNTLTASGAASIDGAFTNQGTVTGPAGVDYLTFDGNVNGAGGFAGNVMFSDGYSPGNSPAAVAFENLTLDNTADLSIELGGPVAGDDYDQLQIAGDLVLDGTLDVSLINGFTLGPQNQFLILDITGTRTGEFSGLGEGAVMDTFGGETLRITYTAGDGNDVALFTPSIDGDYNGDGTVDLADYTIWRNNLGAADDSSLGYAGDGQSGVDEGDYTMWKANFGNSIPLPPAATVPEPPAIWLFGIATVIIMARRYQSH